MRVLAIALALSALLPLNAWAQSPRPGAPTGIEQRDVVYATVPRPLVLDLYRPTTPGPHPVIVWVHGGGWSAGDEDLAPDHPARRQVARGWAVASVEYRLSGEAVFPAPIQDCKAAIRWVRAHAGELGLDPERFVAWGSSAGGHLVALLGTSGGVEGFDDPAQGNAGFSSRVQAVVDWFGPSDLSVGAGAPGANGPVARMLGCTACPETAALASPVTHVDPTDPPFLIQHGSQDPVVPTVQSEILHGALLAAAVPSRFDLLVGAGHGGAAFNSVANVSRVEAFLDAVRQEPR